MKQNTKKIGRRALAIYMSVLMRMTAWVFASPAKAAAAFDVWDGTWDGRLLQNSPHE